MAQHGNAAPAGRGRTALVTGFIALVTLLAVAAALLSRGPGPAAPAASADWAAHGANAAHTQSSPLAQITPANVAALKVAWTYHTGDARPGRSQIQCNPIVVRGVLYATSPQLKVFALDAATGRPKWVFDPFTAGADSSALGVNRGVVYWADADGRDARILVGAGFTLFALDAATGRPIQSFGTSGGVDLRAGLGDRAKGLYVVANTPGTIYKDLLIQGTRVGEGPGPSAPGYVRAYDVRTGAIAWTFHTIPQPGEPGHDTWPADAWTRVGGANSWSGVSDRSRSRARVPADGLGGVRLLGRQPQGRTTSTPTACWSLKADTGAYVWHYQFVRHDIWDRDLPQSPVLVTVRRDGRAIAGGRAGDQDRPRLRVRSRNRRAALPDRGAGRAAVRCGRRGRRRDPAGADGAAGLRAAAVLGRPDHRPVARGRRQRARAVARGEARQHLWRRRASRARSSSPASTAAPNGADPRTTSAPGSST